PRNCPLIRRWRGQSAATNANAVRQCALGVMQHSGRVEAGIYLMGLLAGAPDDWEWRTAIIEALKGFDIEGCARLLFCELRAVKGSNTTRRYRDVVLKTLATLPAGLTRAGFA